MILKSPDIANLLEREPAAYPDRLIIRPQPDLTLLRKSGAASLDLRLGTWFTSLQQRHLTHLDLSHGTRVAPAGRFTREYYVPFRDRFILHPGCFVLAATLEWIRLPGDLAAYVVGRSAWGRRGLIIATAAGVHPGFTGCLTLELSNVGEIPISIYPGLTICQLFFHKVLDTSTTPAQSIFIGHRRPILGKIEPDAIAQLLTGQLHENAPNGAALP